jgi:hypothetical protein
MLLQMLFFSVDLSPNINGTQVERPFFTMFNVFSATETHAKRSSIVAISVANLVWHSIFVLTSKPFLTVLTYNPNGIFTLSGETAFETVSASRSLL